MGRVVVMLVLGGLWTGTALAESVPAPSVRQLPGLEVHALSGLIDLDLSDLLNELRSEQGFIAQDESYYRIPDALAPLIAVPLIDPERTPDVIVLFYSQSARQQFLLRVANEPQGAREARLRGPGGSELVVTAEGVRLEPAVGASTGDAVDCIARTLGVGLDTSSLGRLLASATCTATSLNTLVLTAYNCLSIPHPIATVGCINGIAKLISCGIVNCQPPADCFGQIEVGTAVEASWTSTCPSVHRRGRYARYYSFTLSETTRVEIDLRSSVDPYLYLLDGTGSGGRIVRSDNDSGEGRDARIVRTLSAGTYTIEATTSRSGSTGDFVISLRR